MLTGTFSIKTNKQISEGSAFQNIEGRDPLIFGYFYPEQNLLSFRSRLKVTNKVTPLAATPIKNFTLVIILRAFVERQLITG